MPLTDEEEELILLIVCLIDQNKKRNGGKHKIAPMIPCEKILVDSAWCKRLIRFEPS